jgi:hypothetical protein
MIISDLSDKKIQRRGREVGGAGDWPFVQSSEADFNIVQLYLDNLNRTLFID